MTKTVRSTIVATMLFSLLGIQSFGHIECYSNTKEAPNEAPKTKTEFKTEIISKSQLDSKGKTKENYVDKTIGIRKEIQKKRSAILAYAKAQRIEINTMPKQQRQGAIEALHEDLKTRKAGLVQEVHQMKKMYNIK